MKKIGLSFGGLIFCLFLFCSHSFVLKGVESTSDPAWRSFRGDLRNSGYLRQEIPIPDKLLWKIKLDGRINCTPVVAKDVVFIGSLDKKIYFVDAHTGQKLGDFSFKKVYPSFLILNDDFLYLSSEGEKGTIFCYDIVKGKLDWQKDLGSSKSSPLIRDDRIFLGTEIGRFYALNINGGDPVWQFERKGKILSSPAYSEGLIFLGLDDGWFYALVEKTGGVRWKFKADGGIVSTPAIEDDKVLFGSLDGTVYCLDKNDGELIWKLEASGSIYSSPAVTESSVFIGSNNGFLYKINLFSGEADWKFETFSPIHSPPLVVGDKVFFGSLDGRFYVLESVTGKLLRTYQTSGMITSSPVFYKGKIYVTSEDGYLYCFGQ